MRQVWIDFAEWLHVARCTGIQVLGRSSFVVNEYVENSFADPLDTAGTFETCELAPARVPTNSFRNLGGLGVE